jgi:hypothetical protein
MATFPKPLCELRVLWGERESGVSRPASCQAESLKTSSPTALPLAEQPERQALPQLEEARKNH